MMISRLATAILLCETGNTVITSLMYCAEKGRELAKKEEFTRG